MESFVFKLILFGFIIGCGLIRVPLMKECKKNNNIKDIHSGFEKTKVFIAWLGMCLVPFIYIFSHLLDRFDVVLPLYVRIIASFALIANAVFFYYIHKQLSNNWSPVLQIKEDQKLIKDGIYKYIRHPMYTQSWLWVILQGIVAANWFVLVFGVITWGFMYFTRVFAEENMMINEFGDEYKEYMKNTGRLVPKFL